MAIKISFDTAYNPERPTIILAKRNGDKIGQLNAEAIEITDSLNESSEITFQVHKYINNTKCAYWEQIVSFKLIYCVEWDMWFEIAVETNETTETIKTITCTRLGHAELSQIMLYNIEINTENDIARDDYVVPTVLYNPSNTEASLLHRIMEKAQHYTVIHVDDTIANIQRTFSFDDTSIYDAFQEISEEIGCLFVLHSNSDSNGKIQRTISVYDLESNCLDCGYRGEFTSVCPECGSSNIDEGYGEDTTIFVTADEIADNIGLTIDTGSVKNCFKLEAGDDLMTSTIRNCNPNGTDYIWYFSDAIKLEMSDELSNRIEEYDMLYKMYQKEYIIDFDMVSPLFDAYNFLIDKYKVYNADLEKIALPLIGYPSLIKAYYDTVDFAVYLQSSLMPTVEMSNTNAEDEIEKLTTANLSPVSVTDIANISSSTADNAVLSMAKTVIDSRYKVKISTSNLNENETSQKVWSGSFTITNYSDENDSATSAVIEIVINDDYASFVKQRIQKSFSNSNTEDLSISGLFDKTQEEFKSELQKYSLNYLNSFYSACQSCIDILIEQGIADNITWSGKDPNLYNDLYLPYLDKLSAIEIEIGIRQDEIDLITGSYNLNGELVSSGVQTFIENERDNIQNALNIQNFLGLNLWLELCSFRREDKYSNDNYVSDGLNNTELFDNAYQFIKVAQREIYKSAELQHSISATIKNLLVVKNFEPLTKTFCVGNWIRVMIDDEVYKLRLIKYSINYDDLNTINVEFSDATKINSTIKSIQDVISQASSMVSSYSTVQKQAQKGEKSNSILNDWIDSGLNTTNTKIFSGVENQTQTWDEHGMLFRKYDSINDSYDDTQLKIINSTIAITDDNWKTVKTAIGNYYYHDSVTGEVKSVYGVNGEVIVGKLLIGENLSIYNESGNLTFNDEGFRVTNDVNTVIINPNYTSIFNIKNKDTDILSFDDEGDLTIMGNIAAKSLTLLDGVNIESSKITGLSIVAVSGNYNDLSNTPKLSNVALSGDYNDLSNVPILASVATSGSYNDLVDKPILALVATSGNYNDLTNAPELSKVAISNSYNDLDDKPDLTGIETNTQSIENINIQIQEMMAQIEVLNNAVFNGG